MSPLTEPDDAGNDAASHEPRHLVAATPIRRARALLSTVPLVIVSSIAMSVGLAPPANAATPARRIDRQKTDQQLKLQREVVQPRSAEAAPQTYTVAEGDTVSGIAGRFGLSTASILALNGLSWKSLIFPGQSLILTDGSSGSAPAPVDAQAPIQRYIVVSGDTISGIAAAHGLSTDTVLTANGLDRSSVIYPGQAIALPDPGSAPPAPAPAAATEAAAAPTSAAPTSPAPATPAPATPMAPVAAKITPLTDEMRANALLILQIGRSEGVSDYGIIIAFAAAMQESGLRNVNYGDRDSLGLFQQRPSTGWGTPEQIMDPTTATRSFFGGAQNPHPGLTKGLLDIHGWESMTVSQAAQAVQLSAYPDSYGSWEASARAWLAELG
ncbi:MAG TPA: LysM peptidoglycan-binding domain-containing protein [Microbacteriaceae bacterium]|nr:LysM peptidoglycan-binding domain-containing protein [Microbacteriaceae bacterium]